MDARSAQIVRTKKTKGLCSIVLPLLGAGNIHIHSQFLFDKQQKHVVVFFVDIYLLH